jgi:hypothetical protein
MKRYVALIVVAVLSAGCTAGDSDVETYADSEGNVWIVSDCPNTDQALSGSGSAPSQRERHPERRV